MEFNPEQKAAIESEAQNILVLAGAGTGKTRTIVARTVHLVQNGVPPERIILLTFTRKAANEMKTKIQAELGEHAKRIIASTFHFFCLRLLRMHSLLFALDEFTVIDRDDQNQLMKIARSEIIEKTESYFPKAGELVNYFSYARNTNMRLSDYLEKYTNFDESVINRIKEVVRAYQTRKKINRFIDFDEILLSVADGLSKNEKIRTLFKKKFDHILVDEMQDTNPIQWTILDNLREPAKLFCVGDDAQSIYAFRGADFKNVHHFTEKIPDSIKIKLLANYRSKQSILNLANYVLAASPYTYDKRLEGVRGDGSLPRLGLFYDKNEEADWVSSDILSKHRDGDSFNDMMVLVRSAWSAKVLEFACVEKKIPYRFIGGTSMFESAHVKDLFSLCRCVTNFKDQLAWVRFLCLWPKIGPKTALNIYNQIVECQTADQLIEVIGKKNKKPVIAEALETLFGCLDNLTEVIATAVKIILPIIETKYDYPETRQKDFILIETLAKKHRSLKALLETYTLDPATSSALAAENSDDVLTIITVHSAKGTESKHCYMIQAGPGNYPHSRSLNDKEQFEEERRILYVALTRARDSLTLTSSRDFFSPAHYGAYSSESPTTQLSFISEIPEEFFQIIETYQPGQFSNVWNNEEDF